MAIKLKAGQVDQDTNAPISWQIGDDKGGITIVVEHDEPVVVPPTPIADGYAKEVAPGNLNGFVETSGSPDYKFLGLKPEISDRVLTYTLTLSSNEARTDYSIVDELKTSGIDYVTGSFSGSIVTRSDAGDSAPAPFAFAPTITGKSFNGSVTVPAQSKLTITYSVKITDVAALQTALEAEFAKLNGAPGNYSIGLKNTVKFGESHSRSANVGLGANVPGVGIGNNFAKQGNWVHRDLVTDEDGKLQPAAPMTYTLRADLTPWDERNPNFTLTQNVVVTDKLIDQSSWKTGSGFISISGEGPITALTEATGFTGTAADFAADEFVGKFAVSGNTLFVNVGKDKTTKVDIKVLAQLDTISGLTGKTIPALLAVHATPGTTRPSSITPRTSQKDATTTQA